jgi:hypothetical protein
MKRTPAFQPDGCNFPSSVSSFLTKRCFKLLLLILLICKIPSVVSATNYVWNGSDGNWETAANWTPNGIPGSAAGDNVTINGGAVTLNATPVNSLNDLTMNGGALEGGGNLTVTGVFHWNDGSLSGSALATLTVSGTLNIAGAETKLLTTRTLAVTGTANWTGGDVSLGANTIFRLTSATMNLSAENSFGGHASASVEALVSSEIHKTGAGISTIACKLKLDDANFHLEEGELVFGTHSSSQCSNAALRLSPGGTVHFESGIHDFGNAANILGAEDGSGSGVVDIAGATLNLNSNNSVECEVQLNSGILGGSGDPSFSVGEFFWNGGTITGASGSTKDFNEAMYFDSPAQKSLAGGNLRIISGAAWLDGDIAVTGGAKFTVTAAAAMSIEHPQAQTWGSSTGGTVFIEGTVEKTTNATTTFLGQFTLAPNGALDVYNGIFKGGSGSSGLIQSGVTVLSNATFELESGTHSFSGGSVTGTGTFKVSGATATFSSGSVSCNLAITDGVLNSSASFSAIKSFQMDGGSFVSSQNHTVVTGTNALGFLRWRSGNISGSGSLTVKGATTFESGERTLDAKHIVMENDADWQAGNFSFANNSKISIVANKTFTISTAGTQSAIGSGMIEVYGTLQKTTTSATNISNGDFINMGTVKGFGTLTWNLLTNQGIFAPGMSAGKLTVNNFNNSDGTLEMELGNTGTAGIDYDQLEVTGACALGGTLEVSLINGFSLSIGNKFTLLTCNPCSGNFDAILLPPPPSGGYWAEISTSAKYELEIRSLLPVELTKFTATAEANKVRLTWQTASEQNNKGFDVERMVKQGAWEKIGFVEGAGWAASERHYAFTDESLSPGVYYYRLKQWDDNGQSDYSAIASAEILTESTTGLRVFPNPASGESLTCISPEEEAVPFIILDASGQIVKTGALQPGDNNLEVETFSSGIYLFHFNAPNRPQTLKFEVRKR